MKQLKSEFLLPIQGLYIGMHQYKFQLTDAYFDMFTHSLVKKGSFEVNLELEKKPSMLVLDFDVNGYFQAPCDVCLKQIQIPVQAAERYLIKFSADDGQSDDVLYLDHDDSELDVSELILETIQLHLPLMNKIDCEENDYKDCDRSMLSFLDGNVDPEEEEKNDIWGDLKNIKLK